MSAALPSQVTQLLYRVTPVLNFAQIVGVLRCRFGSQLDEPPTLTWDCDHIALLDFGAARIVIGFSDNLPGPHTACITAAIGQSPLPNTPRLTSADRFLISEAVIQPLVKRFACDVQRSQEWVHPHSLTADLIDQCVDMLSIDEGHPSRAKAGLCGSAARGEDAPILAVPNDMDRLIQRLSSELTFRSPSLITRAIASAIPNGRKAPANEPTLSPPPPQPQLPITDGNLAHPIYPKQMTNRELFCQKGVRPPQLGVQSQVQSTAQAQKTASLTDLKAVRDALYAGDTARADGSKAFGDQTRQALQSLTALPFGLANVVINKWRERPMIETRIKP